MRFRESRCRLNKLLVPLFKVWHYDCLTSAWESRRQDEECNRHQYFGWTRLPAGLFFEIRSDRESGIESKKQIFWGRAKRFSRTRRKSMDIKGFEPLTFSMQSRRSTTDLNALVDPSLKMKNLYCRNRGSFLSFQINVGFNRAGSYIFSMPDMTHRKYTTLVDRMKNELTVTQERD